ncbi:hypothetical protein FR943_00140 [Mycobacterium sp. TNTM28]|uniref:ESX-1 secretion-associated protein EspA/EspE-like domain-containing protein n=1 Tax=[Mycobacterium] fortunisiensis TaxID=2600579 RepID=A0ABS6KFE6_9MYCO|nr:EspA/EspE family type VII secretion system effector [[Mycobacterium] fortunisiensis]MBU9762267.1 hypothetical protein [[Mycobacterium] fortunisiensis]
MGLLGEIAERGKDVIENNLRWTVRAAHSPILHAGQQTIESMKRSTGVGDPENGQRIGEGVAALDVAGQVLVSAAPGDGWDSLGAAAYAGGNADQVGRIQTMIGLDNTLADVLRTEAGQISEARTSLDGHSDWLGSMTLLSIGAGGIPGFGSAARMSAEIAMVAKAVEESKADLNTLRGHVEQNAAVLQNAAARYEAVARDALPSGAKFEPGGGDCRAASAAQPAGGASGQPSCGDGSAPDGAAPFQAGAPLSAAVPAAAPAPSGLPAAGAQSFDAAGAGAGALGAILGSIMSPLSGVLSGLAQAFGQAAQIASQAAGQFGGLGAESAQLDGAATGVEAGTGDQGRDDSHRDERRNDEDADDRAGTEAEEKDERADAGAEGTTGPAEREPAGPPNSTTEHEPARTLPPDLATAAFDGGAAGTVPAHVGADFEQGQLPLAAAATLDRGVPGSAAVIDR